jgi:hypothetical protein
MPFDFTEVRVHEPYTPTDVLVDPTFYIDYVGGGGSSTEARAYLVHGEAYVLNLGSPFGGQNRVVARGARVGDRVCVFDRPRAQFGCEAIELGDDRLTMRKDESWEPVIELRPVNTTTLEIEVRNEAAIGYPVWARVYPDLGYGSAEVALTLDGGVYAGTLELAYPALTGNVQVWVEEGATETSPRRETMVAYAIGGNPGFQRGSGGFQRGSGGFQRGSGAPLVSPDGQMIFFTENPADFVTGTLFTMQGMAGVPEVPAGRTLIGQGYNLVASEGAVLPAGSVSVQYLSNDVLVAGADESDLGLYYWGGSEWEALETVLNTYYNLATAESQGEGVYALMASVKIPLYGPGWNNFAYPVHETRLVTEALASISGYYTTVYGYEPADAVNPWRVYDMRAPEWVNKLSVLEYGKGYWINVSESITLHLTSGASEAGAEGMLRPDQGELGSPWPPTTVYGTLTFSGTPAPDGTEISALIDGVVYAQTSVFTYEGQAGLYMVDVPSDDPNTPDVIEGGRTGDTITFAALSGEAYVITQTTTWDIGAVVNLDLTGKISQTISFGALPDRTYGTPPFTLAATASSGLPVSFGLVTGPAVVAGDAVTVTGAGTVTVRASQPGDAIYAPAPDVERAFAVDPAPLTITADDKSRTQGAPNPPLTASYAGFVGGDSEADLDSPVVLTTTAVLTSPVGTYPIFASGAVDVNYAITHVNGVLTVTVNKLFLPMVTRQAG